MPRGRTERLEGMQRERAGREPAQRTARSGMGSRVVSVAAAEAGTGSRVVSAAAAALWWHLEAPGSELGLALDLTEC